MISLLLLNNFYPVISYRRVRKEKESDELLHTRYGPQSVASAQAVKHGIRSRTFFSFLMKRRIEMNAAAR